MGNVSAGGVMQSNQGLYNAAVIGENPEMEFLVENGHLHPVEPSVAERKPEQNNPEKVLPLMREALEELIKYAKEKVPLHFTDKEQIVSLEPDEHDQLVQKIMNIYTHLPHHNRNEMSTLIHHKQKT